MQEKIGYQSKWTIKKFTDEAARLINAPYDVREIDGNLLLNEGIAEMLGLLAGLGGVAFAEANTYLGVGDSTTAAAASQTGLQASTNKFYKVMAAGYPQLSGQTLTFQAIFGTDEANFDWNEFTVANGNSDAAKNFNRKISAEGVKPSGRVWTLELAITIS